MSCDILLKVLKNLLMKSCFNCSRSSSLIKFDTVVKGQSVFQKTKFDFTSNSNFSLANPYLQVLASCCTFSASLTYFGRFKLAAIYAQDKTLPDFRNFWYCLRKYAISTAHTTWSLFFFAAATNVIVYLYIQRLRLVVLRIYLSVYCLWFADFG